MNENIVLSINNLETSFYTSNGVVSAVRGISYDLHKGEVLGIVGESGSGKTVSSMSVLQLLPENGIITSGEIIYKGRDLTKLTKSKMRKIRGKEIAMVFQDPMSSLNPLMTVGKQVAEMIKEHNSDMSNSAIKDEVIRLLKLVKIPEAEKRYNSYPHEFSGGMRQRVIIAIAIACKPNVLIADEPTTALDVTIQEQILKLIKDLISEINMSVVFITHDLSVVAELCTRVIVMYGGKIMEEGLVDDIFEHPSHPYTMGLLKSAPNTAQDKTKRLMSIHGSPPDMLKPPEGCPFAPRCDYARAICQEHMPPFISAVGEGHSSACWLLHESAPKTLNPFYDETEVI